MVKLKQKPTPSHAKKKAKSSKKSVSPLLQGFIWGGCFTVTATISSFLGITVALKTPIDFTPFLNQVESLKKLGFNSLFAQQLQEPINILIMGVDRVAGDDPFSGRSDTMLLVRLQPEDHSVKILSIPRDSRVSFPDGSYDKINGANAIGGIPLTKEVIANNLDGITVDKYIRVTTDAFKKLVDLMGGVEVYVPMDMKYVDRTQGLYIDLKEGKQTLNGDEAEQFARFRHDNLGDIGRVQRQQILLKALREKIQSPQAIFKIPKTLTLLQEEMDTDLTSTEMLNFITFALTADRENVRMIMLPGRASYPREYSLSYWLISPKDKEKVIQQYLNPDNSSEDISSPQNVRISIQNATSNGQLAKKLALLLEEKGFNNIYINSNSPYPTPVTKIIVQKGDYQIANTIKKNLDFGEIESSSTGDIDSDITIRLGDDGENILLNDTFVK